MVLLTNSDLCFSEKVRIITLFGLLLVTDVCLVETASIPGNSLCNTTQVETGNTTSCTNDKNNGPPEELQAPNSTSPTTTQNEDFLTNSSQTPFKQESNTTIVPTSTINPTEHGLIRNNNETEVSGNHTKGILANFLQGIFNALGGIFKKKSDSSSNVTSTSHPPDFSSSTTTPLSEHKLSNNTEKPISEVISNLTSTGGKTGNDGENFLQTNSSQSPSLFSRLDSFIIMPVRNFLMQNTKMGRQLSQPIPGTPLEILEYALNVTDIIRSDYQSYVIPIHDLIENAVVMPLLNLVLLPTPLAPLWIALKTAWKVVSPLFEVIKVIKNVSWTLMRHVLRQIIVMRNEHALWNWANEMVNNLINNNPYSPSQTAIVNSSGLFKKYFLYGGPLRRYFFLVTRAGRLMANPLPIIPLEEVERMINATAPFVQFYTDNVQPINQAIWNLIAFPILNSIIKGTPLAPIWNTLLTVSSVLNTIIGVFQFIYNFLQGFILDLLNKYLRWREQFTLIHFATIAKQKLLELAGSLINNFITWIANRPIPSQIINIVQGLNNGITSLINGAINFIMHRPLVEAISYIIKWFQSTIRTIIYNAVQRINRTSLALLLRSFIIVTRELIENMANRLSQRPILYFIVNVIYLIKELIGQRLMQIPLVKLIINAIQGSNASSPAVQQIINQVW